MRSPLHASLLGCAAAWLLFACQHASSVPAGATPPSGPALDSPVELALERLPNRKWSASLINHGAEPVVVVLPGDGSSVGWRTPIVRWSVTGEAGEVEPWSGGRCGNVNPLAPDEVVTLEAGESVSLDRYGLLAPRLPKSGSVEVSLTYENVPDLEWQGLPLGRHDARAMVRVRASTPLSLRSNVVRFERAPVEDDAK